MAQAAKLDLFKQHKQEYVARAEPALVTVAAAKYLTIDGCGSPGGEEFQAKIAALYGLAFTIKMSCKFAGGRDYKVCSLEALYSGGEAAFADTPREQWRWKLLIRTPTFIGAAELRSAKEALREKGKPPEFEGAKLETLREARCVQALHVGPYDDEERTVQAMKRLAADQGLALVGPHHEIYLSDPRRTAPERLRTIIRVPVRRADQP